MKRVFFIATILLLVAAALVVLETNREPVVLTFLGKDTPALPLGLILVASFLAGGIVVASLCFVELLTLSLANRKMKKQLRTPVPQPPGPRGAPAGAPQVA